MGMQVEMFFTFWATAALGKHRAGVRKTFLERAFGWMLPKVVRGKACPMPIVLLTKMMRTVRSSEVVLARSTDRAFAGDVAAWCEKTGNDLLVVQSKSGYFEAEVRRA